MAYTPKTLANLKQSLADIHDSGVLPTDSATLAYWTRLLNRAKDYCADRLKLTKSTSLTTSSGTIAFPDDFMFVNEVVDANDLPWTLVAKEQSDFVGPLAYWITGNHDSRFSLNTITGYDQTFTVYYTYRPDDMSSDSDECIIPDPEAVVARAYGMLRKAETDPLGDMQDSMNECERRLDEIIYQRNLNEGGFSFTLQAHA